MVFKVSMEGCGSWFHNRLKLACLWNVEALQIHFNIAFRQVNPISEEQLSLHMQSV